MNKDRKDSIDYVLKAESDSILEVLNNYDEQVLDSVVDAIMNCKGKIIISGCGTSGEAAKKIAHTLSCVECPSVFLSPSDAVHGGLGLVQKEDIVILLSKGGETMELTSMIPAIKQKKSLLIGITENENSSLAGESDIFFKLKISKEADNYFNLLATSSIVALIAVFDAVIITIMKEKGFSKEDFSLIHPGGAVGKKLTGKILYFDEKI